LRRRKQLLTQGEQFNPNKSADNSRVVESAREAAQTAEDARLIAEQHTQEEKLTAANVQVVAAQQAEAQAEARAQAESAARQRTEMEAQAARERTAQVQADAVKLNPRNFRCCGRATALFASFTLSLSFCVMNRVMLSITRCPARSLRT